MMKMMKIEIELISYYYINTITSLLNQTLIIFQSSKIYIINFLLNLKKLIIITITRQYLACKIAHTRSFY